MHQSSKWHDSLSIDSFALSLYDLIQICGCCSDAKLCPTLCNPMDCSMPSSSVLHYLPEFAPMKFSILFSRGKAFFMILSTQLRQVSPCLTHSTPIHFLLSTLLYCTPSWTCFKGLILQITSWVKLPTLLVSSPEFLLSE